MFDFDVQWATVDNDNVSDDDDILSDVHAYFFSNACPFHIFWGSPHIFDLPFGAMKNVYILLVFRALSIYYYV